jgi:hypothetical protein
MLVIGLFLALGRLRSGFLRWRLLGSGLRWLGFLALPRRFWVRGLRAALSGRVTFGGSLFGWLLRLVSLLVESFGFLGSLAYSSGDEVLVALVRSFLAG